MMGTPKKYGFQNFEILINTWGRNDSIYNSTKEQPRGAPCFTITCVTSKWIHLGELDTSYVLDYSRVLFVCYFPREVTWIDNNDVYAVGTWR